MMEKQQVASSGVEQLIEELRDKGVLAGQEKAQSIVSDAQKRAAWIVQEAENEAQKIRLEAQADVEAMQSAGEDALKLAARDALLKLRDNLLVSFSEEVQRLVGEQMAEQEFLRNIILTMAGQVRDDAQLDVQKHLILKLPENAIAVDELKKQPEELQEGSLSHFTASIAANMLRKGVSYKLCNEIDGGLRISLEDEKMSIEFSDEVVTALLLEHLQPRFRSLLQGIVK